MVLKTSDVGGSMIIHTFGAYFGIFVSAVVSPTAAKHGHPNKVSGYYSDVFSMIGTVFLWVYWPSFNSAPASELNQYQTVANTVCSLIGSCVATFFVSRVFRHNGKFEMEDIQNATLAGGVAIGATADMLVTPGGAMTIGLISGIISALGFRYLTPLLEKRLHLHDSCGVNNLHGMTGIMGGIASIIASAIVYQKQSDIMPRGNFQPLFQLATLGHTLGIAILGGLGTGLLLRWLLPAKSYYDDAEFWNMPPDYEILVPEHDDAVDAKKDEEVELDDKNITVDVVNDEADEKIDTSAIASQEVETL
jgi:ammonium transporter Rh